MVLGNARALRAIAEADVELWPDGAALAKIAWSGRRGAGGVIEAGGVQQVEFMFKDSERYGKTESWGSPRGFCE